MAYCGFCNEAKAQIAVRHMGIELPFCSSACSEAFCGMLHGGGFLPLAAASGPKVGGRGREGEGSSEERDADQDKRSRTERANRRAAERAAALARLTQVGWHSLPLELKLLIASHVPLKYFLGKNLALIDKEWARTIAPDPQVWRALYDRLAKFLGAPEHHPLELVAGHNKSAVISYLCMRDYVISPSGETLLLSTEKKYGYIIVQVYSDGTGLLQAAPYILEEMRRLESWVPRLIIRRARITDVGSPNANSVYAIDLATGRLTSVPNLDHPDDYQILTLDVVEREIKLERISNGNEQGPWKITHSTSAVVLSDGVPTNLISYPRPGARWLRIGTQGVKIFDHNVVEFSSAAERILDAIGGYTIASISFGIHRPDPRRIDVSPYRPFPMDIKSIRSALAVARQRATRDIFSHVTPFSSMFGLPPQPVLDSYQVKIVVPMQVIDVSYAGIITPGSDQEITFDVVLAFDGPISASVLPEWPPLKFKPFEVFDHSRFWPAGSTPSAFDEIKVCIEGIPPQFPVVDMNPSPDSLGLDQAWFEAWKARDPARVNLRRGTTMKLKLAEYYPVLGEIRFHRGEAAVTVLSMDQHYLHDHDRWVHLEPDRNPIASEIRQ